MRKPLMLDLCCGRGGWAKGFIAAGWRVIGYDITPQPEFPGRFIRRDVLKLSAIDLARADFVCASTPCEQFALYRMRHFHPSPPFPGNGKLIFDHVRDLCIAAGKPFIMENVYAAQRFIGPAVQHCGSFYFWGNAVPPVFPRHFYSVTKGMGQLRPEQIEKINDAQEKARQLRYRNSSKKRRASEAAEIPFEIAFYIAQLAKKSMGREA